MKKESKRFAVQSAAVEISRLREEVQQLRAELEIAHAANNGSTEAELTRRLELRMVEDREKIIGHLLIVAARRLGRRDLARGLSSWTDAVSRRARSRRLLQTAVGRISRPALSASLAWWRTDWHATAARRAKHEEAKRKEAESEVEKLNLEVAASMRAAAEAAQQTEAQLKQLAEDLQREREDRAGYLQQVALRRMKWRDLARGLSAWRDQHRRLTRARRLRLSAIGRLARPRLSHALQHWRRIWQAKTAVNNARIQEQLLQRAVAAEAQAEAQLTSAREQLEQLQQLQLGREKHQPWRGPSLGRPRSAVSGAGTSGEGGGTEVLHRAERAERALRRAESEAKAAADRATADAKAKLQDAEMRVQMAEKRAERAELVATKLSRRLQATVLKAAEGGDASHLYGGSQSYASLPTPSPSCFADPQDDSERLQPSASSPTLRGGWQPWSTWPLPS